MGWAHRKSECHSYVNRAVFLDRDGVLNRVIVREGRPYAPSSLEEFEFLPGVVGATQSLKAAGFILIVVTNQPDVGMGTQRRDVVETMHRRLLDMLPLDDIRVCYHVDADGCACRKPKPGMLLDAARMWSLKLEECYMVGDRWRDIEAGKAAGCRTILVQASYQEQSAKKPDAVVGGLVEAGKLIMSGNMIISERAK